MTEREQLTPSRDLDLALTVASDVGRVIGAADTKIGFLLATQGVVLAATTQAVRSRPLATGWATSGAITVIAFAFAAVLVLLVALRPRTGGPAAPWMAFTAFRDRGPLPARPDLPHLAEAGWEQVAALAAIARAKFRWLRTALVLSVAELAVLVLWVTLGADAASTS